MQILVFFADLFLILLKKYSIGFKNEGFSEKCAEINEKFDVSLFYKAIHQ
jgi:hypothetical protein